MKKLFTMMALMGVLFFALQNDAQAQAAKQLNFGVVGMSYELPLGEAITIAPAVYTNLDFSYLTLGAKANYYFDKIFGLKEGWDVYGGLNAGFGLGLGDNDDDFSIGAQVGGRWFWSDKWGVYLEAGGGTLGGNGGVGVTMKM